MVEQEIRYLIREACAPGSVHEGSFLLCKEINTGSRLEGNKFVDLQLSA